MLRILSFLANYAPFTNEVEHIFLDDFQKETRRRYVIKALATAYLGFCDTILTHSIQLKEILGAVWGNCKGTQAMGSKQRRSSTARISSRTGFRRCSNRLLQIGCHRSPGVSTKPKDPHASSRSPGSHCSGCRSKNRTHRLLLHMGCEVCSHLHGRSQLGQDSIQMDELLQAVERSGQGRGSTQSKRPWGLACLVALVLHQ